MWIAMKFVVSCNSCLKIQSLCYHYPLRFCTIYVQHWNSEGEKFDPWTWIFWNWIVSAWSLHALSCQCLSSHRIIVVVLFDIAARGKRTANYPSQRVRSQNAIEGVSYLLWNSHFQKKNWECDRISTVVLIAVAAGLLSLLCFLPTSKKRKKWWMQFWPAMMCFNLFDLCFVPIVCCLWRWHMVWCPINYLSGN